jgi:hypothetical protein
MSAKEKTVRVDLTLQESGSLCWAWYQYMARDTRKEELPQWAHELYTKLRIANDKIMGKAPEKRKKAK